MTDISKDNSGVKVPPPLFYALPLVVGLLLNFRFPVKFLPNTIARVLGGISVIASIMLVVSAFREMRLAKTSPNPTQPVTSLVTGGPFRFTRNPIYVSFTLFYGGIALLLNALWVLLLLPLALLLIQFRVINREEHYLEQKFGKEYLSYKEEVRRWI